jgi:membrane protein
VRRFLGEYLNSGASQYANMLAFSLFVATLPLTVGVLTLWGLVTRSPHRFLVAKEVLVNMFPASTQGVLRQVVSGAGEQVGVVALLSLAGLLWFSTGLFSTTGFALNRIYGMPDRPFFLQRLRGLWLAPTLILAAYLAVAVTLVSRRLQLPGVVGPLAIWFAVAWLIGFVYRLAPSRMLSRVELLPGAGLAALGIVGLAYAFPLYAQLTSGLSSGSRFFTVVFGLIAWVYGIAHAILFGAVFNRSLMAARASHRRPSAGHSGQATAGASGDL